MLYSFSAVNKYFAVNEHRKYQRQVISMELSVIANQLPLGVIGKKEILETAVKNGLALSPSSIYWVIKRLIQEGSLARVGRDKYMINFGESSRLVYLYTFSEGLKEIVDALTSEYSMMRFQAWEAFQYNYFVTHLIAHNLYFIEVEDMLEDAAFEFLREHCGGNVLLKPNLRTCMTYARQNTVIVQNIVSEAPFNRNNPHGVVLEKLLVDMMTDPKISLFIEEHEHAHVLEDAFSRYIIDESRFFRYARRRNAERRIKDFIHGYTNIKLLGDAEHD